MTQHQPAYLITGATGFLGRQVLEVLIRCAPRPRIVVLVRNAAAWEAQSWRQPLGDIEVITGELFSTGQWSGDARIADLQGIFHLAAEVKHSRRDVAGMERINVEGTLGMVRLAAEKKCRLLFVSTSGAVSCSNQPSDGVYEDAPYCEDAVRRWPYYSSKIRAEKAARALSEELGVDLVIFRPPVLLGPGDHRYRSTSNVLKVLRRKLPFMLDGNIHFVDIRDAAIAIVRAMRHPDPKPIYHLAGTACTLEKFFGMVAEQAGMKPFWTTLPAGMLWHAARLNAASGLRLKVLPDPVVIEMATHYWDIRSRDAEADLEYSSRPPERTIADTVAWLRANPPGA
ncbi:MAG: NAD-dependent epimerase/dehydratase family protein [Gemmatimonadaceae bacterium]